MTRSDAILATDVMNGLNAERLLHGDPEVFGPSDQEQIQAIISQGKRAEGELRTSGKEAYLRWAYRKARVDYVEPGT